MTTEDTGCPACGMSRWTPEMARRFAPNYMAALESVPNAVAYPVPAEPAAECWDCRKLRAGGHDPAALAEQDLEERGTPSRPREVCP